MKQKKLTPTNVTNEQHEWLQAEKERTGNGVAAILRGLIQDRMKKESGK